MVWWLRVNAWSVSGRQRAGEALSKLEATTLFERLLSFYQEKYDCLVGDY